MLESVAISFVGFALLAATSMRVRRDLGLGDATVRPLRIAGGVMLIATLLHCGAPLTGERFVRCLGAFSLASVLLVAILSFVPLARLRPARR